MCKGKGLGGMIEGRESHWLYDALTDGQSPRQKELGSPKQGRRYFLFMVGPLDLSFQEENLTLPSFQEC